MVLNLPQVYREACTCFGSGSFKEKTTSAFASHIRTERVCTAGQA